MKAARRGAGKSKGIGTKAADAFAVATAPVLLNGNEVDQTADRGINTPGHVILGVLFYASLLVACVFIIFEFLNTPPIEVNKVELVSKYSPVAVEVTGRCLTTSSVPCGPLTVKQNYSSVPGIDSQCLTAHSIRTNVPDGQPTWALLCRVPDGDFSTGVTGDLPLPGVIITYENFTEGAIAELLVTAARNPNDPSDVNVSPEDGFGLRRQLSVGVHMIKTFNLGVVVETTDDKLTRKAPYAINYQMEGSRLGTATDVVLRLATTANVREITTRQSVLELLGNLGGAYETVSMCFTMIIPIFAFLFAAKVAAREMNNKKVTRQEPRVVNVVDLDEKAV